jgi:hypothetical protein
LGRLSARAGVVTERRWKEEWWMRRMKRMKRMSETSTGERKTLGCDGGKWLRERRDVKDCERT